MRIKHYSLKETLALISNKSGTFFYEYSDDKRRIYPFIYFYETVNGERHMLSHSTHASLANRGYYFYNSISREKNGIIVGQAPKMI